MSLETMSISELQAEIERRKTAVVAELRSQIDEHKKAIRELEARIAAKSGKVAGSRTPRVRSTLTAGEKSEKILSALDGKDSMSSNSIAEIVGFDGAALKGALTDLVTEGRLTREGKARGTKYKLA
jgi:predicted HTH transcriptional regulator